MDGQPVDPSSERTRAASTRRVPRVAIAVMVTAMVVAAGAAIAVHAGILGGSGASGWQTVSLPAGFSASEISCVGRNDCWVLGTRDGGRASAIWQHASGTWKRVSASGTGSLGGLTCVTATDCWAVGSHGTAPQTNNSDATSQPLIEHDTGADFLAVSGPRAPGDDDWLDAVTCATAEDCWAVGGYGVKSESGPNPHPLVEHYDGSAWTVVPGAVPPPDFGGELSAVTCVGASECWAVGTLADGGGLIDEYDGQSWTAVNSAPMLSAGPLSAVACASAGDCWAVGYDPFCDCNPLVAGYADGRWTVALSPHVGTANTEMLAGVACLPSDGCWAVGWTGGDCISDWISISTPPPCAGPQPIVERQSGGAWMRVAAPQVGGEGAGLDSVTCLASTGDCYAVGGGLFETHLGP